MYKVGWCIRLGQEGVSWGWGELSEIPYKGVEKKKEEGNKNLKRGGQSGSRGGCLKKGGWNPLNNYPAALLKINFLTHVFQGFLLDLSYYLSLEFQVHLSFKTLFNGCFC